MTVITLHAVRAIQPPYKLHGDLGLYIVVRKNNPTSILPMFQYLGHGNEGTHTMYRDVGRGVRTV